MKIKGRVPTLHVALLQHERASLIVSTLMVQGPSGLPRGSPNAAGTLQCSPVRSGGRHYDLVFRPGVVNIS